MILDVGAPSNGTCKGTKGFCMVCLFVCFYKQNIYTNIHSNDTQTEQKLQHRCDSAGEAAFAVDTQSGVVPEIRASCVSGEETLLTSLQTTAVTQWLREKLCCSKTIN